MRLGHRHAGRKVSLLHPTGGSNELPDRANQAVSDLERGEDGKLHGPCNKKVWASFAGRQAAALWARAEATKRGFGPDTTKTVQIVVDGAKGLKHKLKPLFPKAIFTLDVQHVVEKLWALGHHFHKEGSAELKEWVDRLPKNWSSCYDSSPDIVQGGTHEQATDRRTNQTPFA